MPTSTPYHRFAVTMPERMAEQIEEICAHEGRSRSEFVREAVRTYLAVRTGQPVVYMPTGEDERMDNPFHAFTEWNSPADSVYDALR